MFASATGRSFNIEAKLESATSRATASRAALCRRRPKSKEAQGGCAICNSLFGCENTSIASENAGPDLRRPARISGRKSSKHSSPREFLWAYGGICTCVSGRGDRAVDFGHARSPWARDMDTCDNRGRPRRRSVSLQAISARQLKLAS